MALTRTTLAAAVADQNDTTISVTSATGFAAGYLVRVDMEWMVIQSSYVSGTIIPVRRGQLGTKSVAHVITAGCTAGQVINDWASAGFSNIVNSPTAGRARYLQSITATTSTLAGLVPGTDTTVVLNGTAAITLTIPVPTADQEGDELNIISNGVAQHLLTFTGGLSGAGTSYDVITINSTAPAAFKFVVCNKLWYVYCAPAMGGTVTNIIGSIA